MGFNSSFKGLIVYKASKVHEEKIITEQTGTDLLKSRWHIFSPSTVNYVCCCVFCPVVIVIPL